MFPKGLAVDTRSWWVALLLCGAPALTLAQSASIHVSARILPKVDLRLLHPAELRISASDVQRGFVDAPGPVSLVIRSNTQGPVVVSFGPVSDIVRRTRIAGLGSVVELGPQGGLLALQEAATSSVGLQFRFFLEPGTAPGAYPWPVLVSPAS